MPEQQSEMACSSLWLSTAQVNRRGEVVHFEVWDTLTPKTFMVTPEPSAAAFSRPAIFRLDTELQDCFPHDARRHCCRLKIVLEKHGSLGCFICEQLLKMVAACGAGGGQHSSVRSDGEKAPAR